MIKILFITVVILLTSACKKEEAIKIEEDLEKTSIEETTTDNFNAVETVMIKLDGRYEDENIILDYIPEGFNLTEKFSTEMHIDLTLENENQMITFGMHPINSTKIIDTENAKIEELFINGYDAIYSSNENVNILVWIDGEKKFSLTGKISQKEMIKIAKNTQILRK